MKQHARAILCSLLLASSQSSFANDIQPLDTIYNTVSNYIEEQVDSSGGELKFTVKPLDSRLRLTNCSDALEAFLPRGGRLLGNSTIGIKCTNPDTYWTIYVSAKIEIYTPVVVAQIPLERGTIISKSDVTTQVTDISKLRASYFTDVNQVIGNVVSRRFAIGAPLSSMSVAAPTLVKRGESVTIIASVNSIQVRMSGKALASGKAGETIKVRNNNSERVVEGKVIKAGVVQVRI